MGNRLAILETNDMKRLLYLCAALLLASCEKEHLCDCFKGTGDIVTESRDATPFHSIDVHKKVDVIIRQGNSYAISVEAGDNIIGGIETRISGEVLYITNENKCNWVRSYNEPMRVYVTTPSLRYIYQRGNGNITSEGTLGFDTLYLETWNSGNISLHSEAMVLETRQHVSVGDVSLSGNTEKLYVYNNGNGFAYLSGLHSKIAEVDARGTGETQVRADSLLHYSLSGIGNLYLYGAAVVTGTNTGGGSVIRE